MPKNQQGKFLDWKEGEKTSIKKKLRKLEKRVTSLESTVVQLQFKSNRQLWEDVASDVKKNPYFKKLVGGRTLFETERQIGKEG